MRKDRRAVDYVTPRGVLPSKEVIKEDFQKEVALEQSHERRRSLK